MDAIHPKPAALRGPHRQRIDKWEMEWAGAPRGHWGDHIDWGTARIIASRLDGKTTDPFAPGEKSATSPVPQQSPSPEAMREAAAAKAHLFKQGFYARAALAGETGPDMEAAERAWQSFVADMREIRPLLEELAGHDRIG